MPEEKPEQTKRLLDSQIVRLIIIAVVVVLALCIWFVLSPRTIFSQQGTSAMTRQTRWFDTGSNWSVIYSFAPTSNQGNWCNFGVIVIDSRNYGSSIDKAIILSGSGKSGSRNYRDAGRHSLSIISTCPYRVTVKTSLL